MAVLRMKFRASFIIGDMFYDKSTNKNANVPKSNVVVAEDLVEDYRPGREKGKSM